MRTTIEFPDELLSQAKSRAALEGLSLREFFIAAVRQKLAPADRKARGPVPVIGDENGPPMPDLSREQIDDAMFG
jgi:hypothetical protein